MCKTLEEPLLAFKEEEGAVSQGTQQPLEAGEDEGRDSPWSLQKEPAMPLARL